MDTTYHNYCQPIDVAQRLLYAKKHWFHGKPDIKLEGENGTFGKLSFDFKDAIVDFNVFIKDRQQVLNAAQMAVLNFSKLSNEIWNE